jgi:adenylate cyclase
MPESGQKAQTILFADIAGSTRLYEQLGDTHARMLVSHCFDMLSAIIRLKHGKLIKTIGDEVMCTFDLPDDAVCCAFSMQEDLTADTTLSKHHMQLRIGLHHGPVIEEEDDIYGDAVNMAARMVEHAKAGQIITSDATVGLLGRKYRSSARMVEQARIKGKFKPVQLLELMWGHPEELTMITTVKCHRDGKIAKTTMILYVADCRVVANPERPVVTIGRDLSNDIVFNDPKVSRLHARIELRKDKFVLVDQSTNGTYVLKPNGESALLRWDEIQLMDRGLLAIGEKSAPDAESVIRFEIQ